MITAGTIDKCYPKTIGGWAFDIGPPALPQILARARAECIPSVTIARKDSQEIDDGDR